MPRTAITTPLFAVRNIPYSLTDTRTSGARIVMGDNLDKEYTDSFSWSGLFFIRDGSSSQGLISKRRSSGAFTGWDFRATGGKISFTLRGTSISKRISLSTVEDYPLNEWFHLTFVWTGDSSPTASNMKIYINRNIQDLSAASDSFNDTSTINSANLVFGWGSSVTANTLDGYMTDMRLHNAALTQSQVDAAFYNNPHVSVEAYWPFTDGAGSTLTETIGGINGTITTFTWSANTPFKAKTAVTVARTPITVARTPIT